MINCWGIEKNVNSPTHGHVDFIFIGSVDDPKIENKENFAGIRWFHLNEIEQLDTFDSVKYWARQILK